MNALKVVKSPYTSLAFNFLYALGNCAVGFYAHSWWFITMGAYYAILTVARFCVLQIKRKAAGDHSTEQFAKRFTGIMLMALSVCIIGVNVLCAIEDRSTAFHKIIMIAIATYTFTKITLAIIGMVKAKRAASPAVKTLRNIALSDACVSVYTLQRSMLVSFPGMKAEEIQLFNILTGTAVWIVVLLLGIHLLGGKYVDMAKSKIAEANKKIAQTVTDGYKTIEKGVVDSYRKIEDKFVDAYLTKDGETVEEAKERLHKQSK